MALAGRWLLAVAIPAISFLVAVAPGTASAQTGLDAAHQKKLEAALTTDKNAHNTTFHRDQAALLGVSHNGQDIPVRKIQFYNDRILFAASRIEAGTPGYFFFHDPERKNPAAAAIAFRTDKGFRLVGPGIEWIANKPQRMSLTRSAELFTEQMTMWKRILDGELKL